MGAIACSLSGCGTLLGSKMYDTGVSPQFYNETKHQFLPYKRRVLLADKINGAHCLITNESDHFITIAGTPDFDEQNFEESMRPFVDFLHWAKLKGPEQEKQRLIYNQEPAMKKRYIQFRYFPDGTPAFADVLDERFFYEKWLVDGWIKYYTYDQVRELLSIASAAAYLKR